MDECHTFGKWVGVTWSSDLSFFNVCSEKHSSFIGKARFRRATLSCDSSYQTSSLKPLGWLKPNFIWSLLGMGGTKVCSNGLGHMTKMAAKPIYCKNLLLQVQKADDLETWYAASAAQVLPNLFKWWHLVDLDLFYSCQIWSHMVLCGKKIKQWIFQKLLSSLFETNKRWLKWQEVSVDIKILFPGGCMLPAPGLYNVLP